MVERERENEEQIYSHLRVVIFPFLHPKSCPHTLSNVFAKWLRYFLEGLKNSFLGYKAICSAADFFYDIVQLTKLVDFGFVLLVLLIKQDAYTRWQYQTKLIIHGFSFLPASKVVCVVTGCGFQSQTIWVHILSLLLSFHSIFSKTFNHSVLVSSSVKWRQHLHLRCRLLQTLK